MARKPPPTPPSPCQPLGDPGMGCLQGRGAPVQEELRPAAEREGVAWLEPERGTRSSGNIVGRRQGVWEVAEEGVRTCITLGGLQSLPTPSTFEGSEGRAGDTTTLEVQEKESLLCYPKGDSWGNWTHWWDGRDGDKTVSHASATHHRLGSLCFLVRPKPMEVFRG